MARRDRERETPTDPASGPASGSASGRSAEQDGAKAPDKQSFAGTLVWKAMTVGSTVFAARAAAALSSQGWKIMTGRPVPVKGDYERERTSDVVAYTALSAMVLTGFKVGLERKAAEYYRHSTGHLPKGLVETKLSRKEKKAHKKIEKAAQKAEQTAKQAAESAKQLAS